MAFFLCVFSVGGCYKVNMTPDSELLRRYARTHSEDPFAELLRRHLDLVYSAALRRVNGDAHLAQDVAQTVFADLARKAGSLGRRESLTGWLYTSAHFAAAKMARTENRRHDREEKFMREPANEAAPPADWENIRPALDDAMHELKESDREAILLRYFENRPFAEVGAKLGLNENATRMRVERALEKLRTVFVKRGITTASALAAVISANAVQTAPAGLAATLTAGSLAAAGTGTTLSLLKIMTATQLKLGISALVVAGAATAMVVQHQAQTQLRSENASLERQIAQLKTDNESLSNRLADAGKAKSLTDKEFNELLRLRGEVGSLRNQIAATKVHAQTTGRSIQSAPDDTKAQETLALKMRKITAVHFGLEAIRDYARHHQDQFPTDWSSLNPVDIILNTTAGSGFTNEFVPDTAADFTELTNEFEMVYQGSMTNLRGKTNWDDIMVVREKQPWQTSDGKWEKVYGYIDGHVQQVAEPDGNFDAYEQQHIVPSPTQ
jgi:RNA polymerase sigma factor (sigma-70 family)